MTITPFEGGKGSIPYYPEEDKSEKLAGAPMNEASSAFYPSRVWTNLTEYAIDPRSSTLSRTAGNFARDAIYDPNLISRAYNQWEEERAAIIPGKDTEYYDRLIAVFRDKVDGVLESTAASSKESILDPKRLFTLLDIATDGDYQKQAEAIVRGLVSKEKDQERVTDFRYMVAEWSLKSQEPAKIAYALEVLCFDADVYTENSRQAHIIADMTGGMSLKDETLLKNIEVENFIHTFGPTYAADSYNSYIQELSGHSQSGRIYDAVSAYYRMVVQKDRTRYDKMKRFIDKRMSRPGAGITVDPEDSSTFPYNLITKRGVVGTETVSVWHRLAGRELERLMIKVPGQGPYFVERDATAREFIGRQVWEAIKKENELHPGFRPGDAVALDHDEMVTVLDFLTPDIPMEKIPSLMGYEQNLRDRINLDVSRTLSPRGDIMRISDQTLRFLGYEAIGFSFEKGVEGFGVDIYIGSYKAELTLNAKLQLVDHTNRIVLSKPPHNIDLSSYKYIELVVLGHLEELLCSEDFNPDEQYNAASGKKGRGVYSRRAHPRRLDPNENPHPSQIALAWEYNIDLVRLNEERVAAGMPIRTFVREVEKKSGGTEPGPIISRAKHATDKLIELLR